MPAIIGAIVGWIWTGIQAVGTGILYALQIAFNILKAYAVLIGRMAKEIWSNVLKPVGSWLHGIYEKVHDFYNTYLKKYHDWLTRIVKTTRQIYDTFFAPIINTIDAVRNILKLLELLHLDFAAKLDAELAALETKIVLPVQTVIQTINAIDSRIEKYILTLDNLFNKVTMLNSIKRDVDQIRAIHWASFANPIALAKLAAVKQPAPVTPLKEQSSRLDTIVAGEQPDDAIDTGEFDKWLDDALAS